MTLREASVRVRLDPTNPGHFFASCGLLELADRCWRGAEGWFTDDGNSFCLCAEEGRSSAHTAASLIQAIRSSELVNTMTPQQLARRDELSALGTKQVRTRGFEEEKKYLDMLWREAPLVLRTPVNLRLDWFIDERSGGAVFKTWAGQQSVIDIARDLKEGVSRADWKEPHHDWLFERTDCDGLPFNFDAEQGAMGSDRDVGFSFDPLKSIRVRIRPLVEFLALVGLQRFRPLRRRNENRYMYSIWFHPLPPSIACTAACGLLGPHIARTFELRLLYRTKYLKSFLPAIPAGDHQT